MDEHGSVLVEFSLQEQVAGGILFLDQILLL